MSTSARLLLFAYTTSVVLSVEVGFPVFRLTHTVRVKNMLRVVRFAFRKPPHDMQSLGGRQHLRPPHVGFASELVVLGRVFFHQFFVIGFRFRQFALLIVKIARVVPVPLQRLVVVELLLGVVAFAIVSLSQPVLPVVESRLMDIL